MQLTADEPETHSIDLIAENQRRLKEIFPDAFTEGKIDFSILKQLLSDDLDEHEEKYALTWHGKRCALQLALTPSTGTLRPYPKESINWDTTKNLIIEGDNLETLKLLQRSYADKIKLIYIDPPYNTGRDFIYPDDFRDNIKNYLELTGQLESGRKITANAETSGRFHTDWLNMIYPRLKLARNLLREDGIIFISIGESEVANLTSLCDQIFGEENRLGIACRVAKKSNNKGDHWSPNFDYIVTYSRDRGMCFPFSGGVNIKAYDHVDPQGAL
jgi:adenine-specific DNA-methyltransferase